ncbi:MAG: hypothetical protein NVS4B8_10250 [Herpetosiphon sp.]
MKEETQQRYEETAEHQFRAHQQMVQRIIDDHLAEISAMAVTLVHCYRTGHKSLWCGNGGSAADAQHLSAELVGRYLIDRPPLPALSLHTDTSALTAIANDFGYELTFARQAEAHLVAGDVLVCLSTSGHSTNVIRAAEVARKKGCAVLGLLGRDGGQIAPLCDHALIVPAPEPYLVQEVYMMVGHYLCDQVEQALFGSGSARSA